MRHSHTVQRRRTIQRSLRRLKHRIRDWPPHTCRRLAGRWRRSPSPRWWRSSLLGWHELLAMAVVFAVILASGRDGAPRSKPPSTCPADASRLSDTVKVDVCVDNPGRTPHHRRAATCPSETTTNGSPFHARRRPVTPDDCGIHRRQPRGAAHRPAIHPQGATRSV